MTHLNNWIGNRQTLRLKAEAMVASLAPSPVTASTSEVLLHELMLHKVEMEMQIEDMKRAIAESEDWRLRYQLLYESAPVGCVRIDQQGLMLGINVTGADMLGGPEANYIGQPFARYVSPTRDSDNWHLLLTRRLNAITPAPVLFALDMVRADGTHFSAQMSARCLEMPGPQPQVHLAMIERLPE